MTVNDLIAPLGLSVLVEGDLQRPVTGAYCGDLLSWVMGRAPAGSAWFSVMGNTNAIAVCVLADLPCLILCEDAPLDEAARIRAAAEGVSVLASEKPAAILAATVLSLL